MRVRKTEYQHGGRNQCVHPSLVYTCAIKSALHRALTCTLRAHHNLHVNTAGRKRARDVVISTQGKPALQDTRPNQRTETNADWSRCQVQHHDLAQPLT